MSMNKKFVCLVAVGILLLLTMMYIVPFSSNAHGQEKALKHVHKGHHYHSETVEVKAPPTTPSLQTVLAEHVKKACKAQNLLGKRIGSKFNPALFDHILVDDRYKMLYCYIPKVACTNWKRILLVLSGKVKVKNVLDISGGDVHGRYKRAIPALSSFSKAEIQYRLDNYFKFMFVREPFERLLSAWRNKFLSKVNPYFWKQFGRRIVRRFRDSSEMKAEVVVRYDEFLQYIVDPVRTEALNEHWATYHRLCLPCFVQYDFVGKYENLDEDAEHVLKSVHADHAVHFPMRSASYKHNRTSSYLASYYRNISVPLLRRVYSVYKKDFELFDYGLPAELDWMFS